MPDYTRYTVAPQQFTGTVANLNKMTVHTRDPSLVVGVQTHFLFDFITAQGWAAGVLPADGADAPVPSVVDLSRIDKLALPLAQRDAPSILDNVASKSKFSLTDGRGGWKMIATNYGGTRITQVGAPSNQMCHPPTEGFKDFLFQQWMKSTGVIGSGQCAFGAGNNNSGSNTFRFWGFGTQFGGGGVGKLSENLGTGVISALAADTWCLVGVHYRYDIAGNKIYVRRFFNGAEIGVETQAPGGAWSSPTLQAAALTNGYGCGFSDRYVPNALMTVGRIRRDFTNLAGYEMDAAAVAATVQAEWLANKARIANL